VERIWGGGPGFFPAGRTPNDFVGVFLSKNFIKVKLLQFCISIHKTTHLQKVRSPAQPGTGGVAGIDRNAKPQVWREDYGGQGGLKRM
jgi:hypothetical protein